MKSLTYDYNVATLPAKDVENARNHAGQKEEVNRLRLIVFDARRRREHEHSTGLRGCVDARFWMGRSSQSSVVYCSIWVHTRSGRYLSGRGTAGGGGYHKESAALQAACDSAGIKLKGAIDGRGEHAMSLALEAIGKAAGYGRCPMEVL